ncbi:hypothetical protein [Actinomadura parmotrematis]|uniref:Uncharacterized protein n=1 Tax=Actinomadura parmotrematis TaxID=2864039 RepID=A0ABS7FS12_9ACTN|nr:hypothetical protein [Actinomadura parmotrematis]MBW8482514.1 hypothetical protein [Actinomadura parmotrematis]
MPVFPSDAPFPLGPPERFHAVHRGREYRASADELAAAAVLEPAAGPGLRVDPAELDAWTRDRITFRWRGEPFVYRGHDKAAGVAAGDYAGADPDFAAAHLRRYGRHHLGYLPLSEITDFGREQDDLLAVRAGEARTLASLDPLAGGLTFLDRGEAFEPYALDGLWVKCRHLGGSPLVRSHWILRTEPSPGGGTTGFVSLRPSALRAALAS